MSALRAAKNALDPFADLYSAIYRRVAEATDEELSVLVDAPELLTEVNCWWCAYRVAPFVAKLAGDELASRKRDAMSPEDGTP